ncbi:hypothetical protein DE146DRAFT_748087 [Phaeosphaeria sp. MPI-PUGE-AT-0046c]|nr:hypothetical protein DE146DRAFT_748087 [Phaeosphaeria sp. MPI-PUGE-AT-0046c]
MATAARTPDFEALPADQADDELGMLNLITTDVVSAAAQEIKSGVRISLDLPLDESSHSAFDRSKFHHEIHNKSPMTMNNDEIRLKTKRFYNGHQQDAFVSVSGPLGIDMFSSRGEMIGRGELSVWYTWAQKNGIYRSPFKTGAVELLHLTAIMKKNSISFRPAGMIFIRVAFIKEYDALTLEQREDFPTHQPRVLLDLEATKERLKWLWESRFVAIVLDAVGVERGPATGPYNVPDVNIHQWCLAGWGMPIGELFNLKQLAHRCQEEQSWTVFLQSMPFKADIQIRSPCLAR